MPRLPIAARLLPFGLIAALALLSVGYAQAEVVVRNPGDLASDKDVSNLTKVGKAITSATVIYDHCGPTYGVTDEKKQRLVALFRSTADATLKAYHDAYEKRVGYPPDAQTVADYTKRINADYKHAAEDVAGVIGQKQGCETSTLRSIIRYVEPLLTEPMPTPQESQ